ncbi:MAG: hypothetical protein HYW25_02345 [Candidatus Aenigmarchaeota archaeon]|nr:hypothetical protein [Candidatus Aenigmarchaeota archaeon]
MKKRTKIVLGALAIILIFGMSSITYIVFSLGSFINPQQQQQEQQQQQFSLDQYVFYEALSNFRKSQIIQNGLTVVTMNHKTGCCQDSITFLESLPQIFQNQVAVEILEGDKNELQASSLRGTFKGGVENKNEILETVCLAILDAPPDCGIILIGGSNST